MKAPPKLKNQSKFNEKSNSSESRDVLILIFHLHFNSSLGSFELQIILHIRIILCGLWILMSHCAAFSQIAMTANFVAKYEQKFYCQSFFLCPQMSKSVLAKRFDKTTSETFYRSWSLTHLIGKVWSLCSALKKVNGCFWSISWNKG